MSADKVLQAGDLVCVTGASGFLGTHVVKAALARGLRVRGTVRDPGNAAKTAHLKAMAEELGAADRLTLVAADLLTPGSFDEALAGCDGLAHVAAVARFSAPDPQRDIVDPSVEGVRNVYASAVKAGTVRAVVHTSSVAAILRYADARKGHVFTEADWNTESQLHDDPYGYAKAVAERSAWDLQASVPEDSRFRLVTINPALILGHVYTQGHVRTSPTILRDLMVGTFPACPAMHFGVVDVEEVAMAHVEALLRPDAEGRYILCGEQGWLIDLSRRLAALYPDAKFPLRKLPKLLMYVASIFDKRVDKAMLDKLLDAEVRYDNTRSREGLGVVYRPLDDTLRATADSMVRGGWAKLRRR